MIVNGTANGSVNSLASSSGILAGVPAGTQTVKIMEKTAGSPASSTNGGDVRVVAIALGG